MASYTDSTTRLPSNPLDNEVNSDLTRVCKCVLPYLDRNAQKQLAISLKALELISTIQLFQDDMRSDTFIVERNDNWEDELLLNIRDNISSDKSYLIDAFIKLREVNRIMKNPKTESSPTTESFYPEVDPQPFYNTQGVDPEVDSFMQMFGNAKHTTPNHSTTDTAPKANKADLLSTLSPLLDENQQQLLKVLSTLVSNK